MEPGYSSTEPRRLAVEEEIAVLLADAECTQVDAHRQAAWQAERMLRVVQCARRHPELYVDGAADAESIAFAERAAVFDLALRMNLSEDHVRHTVHVAEVATTRLPELWSRARTGFASPYLVQRTVGALHRVQAPVGASPEEHARETAAVEAIDLAAAVWSETSAPATFNRRLKALVDRLAPLAPEKAHAAAMRDRRVAVEDVDGGMSWFSILLPTPQAHAAFRRATATAKKMPSLERCGRTRDQLRSDLAAGWLLGAGTAQAVKTKVVVTVPVQLLAAVRDGATIDECAAAAIRDERAEVVGLGAIDPVTARQLFLDASSFRRVITDPVRGVVLDMDRRTYRPTKVQRDWIILQHGTCARDGCERLAVDADIDHRTPWANGGTTDIANLAPLCPRDHRHNHRTRARYRSRPDRTVQVTTPTGFDTTPAPF
ncbi:HNH endonuclease signature motif containing protein [Microbacterium sp. NPDC055903]